MNLNRIKDLIKRYEQGKLTGTELSELEAWFHSLNFQQQDTQHKFSETQMFQDFQARLQQEEQGKFKIPLPRKLHLNTSAYFRFIAIAAAVLLIVGFVIWNDVAQQKTTTTLVAARSITVDPGTRKAVLTLSDGSQLDLKVLKDGYQRREEGFRITKINNKVIYEAIPNTAAPSDRFNTITTPKGGEFEISLPDGSRAWLNAESSLRFPLNFKQVERDVELVGEGYFEVQKQTLSNGIRVPFKVHTASISNIGEGQTVFVLGTHFNINAYRTNESIKTTLLEGSVKVVDQQSNKNSVLLRPGEQSILASTSLTIAQANLNEAMAWKNGRFYFYNTSLRNILQQLERWYNIDVDYKNLPNKTFNGDIPRNLELSKVLMVLEKTSGYQFKIELSTNSSGKVERRLVMDR